MRYELCVRGAGREELASAFEEFEVAPGDRGMVLAGQVADQAALYGVIARVRDLHLDLVWIRVLRDDLAS